MKIKVYSLLHNDIESHYTLDYAGGEVNEGIALHVLREAKLRFRIRGKTFIMVAEDDAFFLTRVDKKWKSYKLVKGTEEHEQN